MEKIEPGSPLEGIRCRPDFYVRADELGSIPDQLLQAALCHPLAELQCGTASRLSVGIGGLSARIADDGPGWPVHEVPGGRRFAETLLSELYACRDHKEHSKLARSLCRITLPVVVALSEWFVCEIFREGEHWRQSYRNGVAEGPLSLAGACDTSGTVLTFSLDPQFCGGPVLSAEAFSQWLKTLPPGIPKGAVHVHAL